MTATALWFYRSAQVSRAFLYGATQDPQLPAHLINDARIPFLGFAGSKYSAGGVVLLAINPGGGGDVYQTRTPQDSELIPLIEAFVKSSKSAAPKHFEAMSRNYSTHVRTWNLWRILWPVLQACRKNLNEVVYLNCFPYRTAGNRMPKAIALRSSWTNVVEPLLMELKPATVVGLGKKVGGFAERQFRGPGKLYVVPRTIGDTQVSKEAKVVLKALRQHDI